MTTWRPTIAIVGTGAVGGYYGGRLAQHGHDVHFLLRSDYQAVRRNGLLVRSCLGDFAISPETIRAYDDSGAMPPAQLVIVALKTSANDQYQKLISPLVREETIILTVQNGLGNEEQLAGLFGAERILGGTVFACINRIGPGIIHHTDYGQLRIGPFLEQRCELARKVVDLMCDCGIDCQLLSSLRLARWEKLVWNVPFNGLGAVLDATTDVLIGDPSALELVRSIMGEVLAAARAHGVDLPEGIIDARIANTRTMGAYKTSMQIDRQLRRPMEVEAILGEPVRAARRVGVSVPRMAMLYELARLVNLGNLSRGA